MNSGSTSPMRLPAAVKRRAARVRIALFDVDGVLTDGRLYYSDSGQEMKAFSVKDGMGLRLLREAGIKCGLVTARKSALVEARARDLQLHYAFQGVRDKLKVVDEVLAELKLGYDELLYMGDDLVDLAVLQRAGLAVSVPDADPLAISAAHYVTTRGAGAGAVREVAELVLRAQGRYADLVAQFTSP